MRAAFLFLLAIVTGILTPPLTGQTPERMVLLPADVIFERTFTRISS